LTKEQSLPILNVLGLTRPARAGLELTTFRLLSESTTTRLRQSVFHNTSCFALWFFFKYAHFFIGLSKEQSLPILNVLGLTRPARAGLELTTFRLLSESTTTRLRQPVFHNTSCFALWFFF
jgi:hypothetical protein